jgi:hypothetical protein
LRYLLWQVPAVAEGPSSNREGKKDKLPLATAALHRQERRALLCLPRLNARVAFASARLDERVKVVRAIIYGDLFSNIDFLFG